MYSQNNSRMESVLLPLLSPSFSEPVAQSFSCVGIGTITDPWRRINANVIDGVAQVQEKSSDELDKLRMKLVQDFEPLAEEYVKTTHLIPKSIEITLRALADYCSVAITLAPGQVLIQGLRRNVLYAKYKVSVALQYARGYSVMRVDAAFSKHPLICGPRRQFLRTLFDMTGVNVYMPPFQNPPPKVSVDELWLVGDEAQVYSAYKLVHEVLLGKIEVFGRDISILASVSDVLRLQGGQRLERLMVEHATFIQFSGATTLRIQGTTRNSIDRTVDALLVLCSEVSSANILYREPVTEELLYRATKVGAIIAVDSERLCVEVYGFRDIVKAALMNLEAPTVREVRVSLEAAVALKEFVIGKKHGKVSKIMAAVPMTSVIVLPSHNSENLRISVQNQQILPALKAVRMLEDEMPAEKWIYIPETFHKQVIGFGGQNIQTLMRKYNVYIRFNNYTGREFRFPNALGVHRAQNVLVRCPAKNAASIDAAVADLRSGINTISTENTEIRMSRNHRRLLDISPNAVMDIETSCCAHISLPPTSQDAQQVEIRSLGNGTAEAAADQLKSLLPPRDYELRVPWTNQFSHAVGASSQFAIRVTAPLFCRYDALVQTFERVQMRGDSSVYGQVVVSAPHRLDADTEAAISDLITSYLRDHDLDIVDKGSLRTDPPAASNSILPPWTLFGLGPPSGLQMPFNFAPQVVRSRQAHTSKTDYDTPIRRRLAHF